jgi:hypothetical protein
MTDDYESMNETMERVAIDDYYETRGKICWHCGGKKICGCVTCSDESGPKKCVVCSGKAKWNNYPEEKPNAVQHNNVMKQRFKRYLESIG